jgi:pyruvate dehydrogenase E2 component (dihydrolipoamide acetyltransferase)
VAVDVVIPEVGEMGMDVVFVRWRKDAGDTVAAGDILFELDTEKTVVEVEAWTAGILADLGVRDGDIVTPRQVVARILAPGEVSTADPASADRPIATVPEGTSASSAGPSGTGASSTGTAIPSGTHIDLGVPDAPSVSPRARALARELGIDPSTLRGTGSGGMVTEQDVRMAAASGGLR